MCTIVVVVRLRTGIGQRTQLVVIQGKEQDHLARMTRLGTIWSISDLHNEQCWAMESLSCSARTTWCDAIAPGRLPVSSHGLLSRHNVDHLVERAFLQVALHRLADRWRSSIH